MHNLHSADRTLDDPNLPLFSVGQTSSMLGVQQALLRRLDTQKIVVPARSDGHQRRYSRRDIRHLEHVLNLIDEGLTLPAVRRILALQAEIASLRNALRARTPESPRSSPSTNRPIRDRPDQ